MQSPEPSFALNRFLQRQSNLALVFFVLSSTLLALAGGTAWLLVRTSSFTGDTERLIFPSAFLLSTVCLAAWLPEAGRCTEHVNLSASSGSNSSGGNWFVR